MAISANCSRPHFFPTNVIVVYAEGIAVHAVVDTGAAVSVISEQLRLQLRKVTTPFSAISLRTASAEPIDPLGACTVRVSIDDALYHIEFVVLPRCSHAMILGWNFLSSHDAVIDCARPQLSLSPFSGNIFEDCSGASGRVLVATDTDVPPFSSTLVPVSCASISDSTVLFTPSKLATNRHPFLLPFALLTVRQGVSALYIVNMFSCPATLHHDECLGYADELDPSLVYTVPDNPAPVQVDAVDVDASPAEPSREVTFSRCIDPQPHFESARPDCRPP